MGMMRAQVMEQVTVHRAVGSRRPAGACAVTAPAPKGGEGVSPAGVAGGFRLVPAVGMAGDSLSLTGAT